MNFLKQEAPVIKTKKMWPISHYFSVFLPYPFFGAEAGEWGQA